MESWNELKVTAFVISAVLITVVFIANGTGTARADTDFGGPLHTEGRRFIDPAGRVVALHGIFAVWKNDALRPVDSPSSPNAFLDEDAENIKDAGFNLVRLAWYWEGLEPVPGIYDTNYLDDLEVAEGKLAGRGVYTLLDAHQDQYNKLFGDKPGFPAWSALFGDLAPSPKPFPLGYFQPATGRAFANLYANQKIGGLGEGIADRFGDAWRTVADRFSDHPMTIGYDLVNEPFPGTQDGFDHDCSTPTGCPDYDTDHAQPFQNRLASAVREADPDKPVFYEPSFFFNSGSTNHYQPVPANLRPAGFSFHAQCSTHGVYQATGDASQIEKGWEICPKETEATMANSEATAAQLGGPPLMTEVSGTSSEDDRGLNCVLESTDRYQTGFTFGLGPGRLRSPDLNRPGAPYERLVLSRVYPRAVAGTPTDYFFDVRTGEFNLDFTPDHSIGAPTVITVPAAQYSNGYDVSVTGGTVTSAPGAAQLKIASNPGQGKVSVHVSPKPGDTVERPDFPACPEFAGPDPDPDPDPVPDPDPQPTSRIKARILKVRPGNVRSVIQSHRISVRIRCSEACRIKADGKIGGMHLPSARGHRASAGEVHVVFPVSRKRAHHIGRLKQPKLRLTAVVTRPDGTGQTRLKRTVKLRGGERQ